VDGRPSSTADDLALSVLTGDPARARALEDDPPSATPYPRPVSAREAAALVATRSSGATGSGYRELCAYFDAAGCYGYGRGSRALVVAIDCDGRRWKVAVWLRSF
jgi:hypothetical protein